MGRAEAPGNGKLKGTFGARGVKTSRPLKPVDLTNESETSLMPDIDHALMTPPSLRIAREYAGPAETAYVWDFRIAQPNVSHLAMPVIHTIEHFLGSSLPAASSKILNVAPMGCQTGFYIVAIGLDDFDEISDLVAAGLKSVLDARGVPLANTRQCGWAENHSLPGAQHLSGWLLGRRLEWREPAAGGEGMTATTS